MVTFTKGSQVEKMSRNFLWGIVGVWIFVGSFWGLASVHAKEPVSPIIFVHYAIVEKKGNQSTGTIVLQSALKITKRYHIQTQLAGGDPVDLFLSLRRLTETGDPLVAVHDSWVVGRPGTKKKGETGFTVLGMADRHKMIVDFSPGLPRIFLSLSSHP